MLNIAYNILSGGQRLEDIELRRQDESFLNGLGTQRSAENAPRAQTVVAVQLVPRACGYEAFISNFMGRRAGKNQLVHLGKLPWPGQSGRQQGLW